MHNSDFPTVTDGIVRLRAATADDACLLDAARDEEFERFLSGGDDSLPIAVIVHRDRVVGWIDYDVGRAWLHEGDVNIGYFVIPASRGQGIATRALELLMIHLGALRFARATLLIDNENASSLGVAVRAGFIRAGAIGASTYFTRALPDALRSRGRAAAVLSGRCAICRRRTRGRLPAR